MEPFKSDIENGDEGYTDVLDDEEREHEEDDDYPLWGELIGNEKTVAIAFEHVKGTVMELELEDEDDTYIYDIEMFNEMKEFQIEMIVSTI